MPGAEIRTAIRSALHRRWLAQGRGDPDRGTSSRNVTAERHRIR